MRVMFREIHLDMFLVRVSDGVCSLRQLRFAVSRRLITCASHFPAISVLVNTLSVP